jgi:hypothetical protein
MDKRVIDNMLPKMHALKRLFLSLGESFERGPTSLATYLTSTVLPSSLEELGLYDGSLTLPLNSPFLPFHQNTLKMLELDTYHLNPQRAGMHGGRNWAGIFQELAGFPRLRHLRLRLLAQGNRRVYFPTQGSFRQKELEDDDNEGWVLVESFSPYEVVVEEWEDMQMRLRGLEDDLLLSFLPLRSDVDERHERRWIHI